MCGSISLIASNVQSELEEARTGSRKPGVCSSDGGEKGRGPVCSTGDKGRDGLGGGDTSYVLSHEEGLQAINTAD